MKLIGIMVVNEVGIKSTFANLPNLPHSLHLLDYSIYRFLASVKPVLIIRVYETLRSIQGFINLIQLSLLTITGKIRNHKKK